MAVAQIAGQKFGRYTVKEFAGLDKSRKSKWLCVCDCGNEKVVLAQSLKAGLTKSCGCIQDTRTPLVAGQRFGRLVVVGYHSRNKQPLWTCVCDCGKEIVVSDSNLKYDNTYSCGCLQDDNRTKHGHSPAGGVSREYQSWSNMKSRCLNPNTPGWEYYGGRTDPGPITICARWLNSFPNFLEDMGPRPPNTSIHRVDNDRGYFPENCVWATPSEQNYNKRVPRRNVA
jgi:hypothetical protein